MLNGGSIITQIDLRAILSWFKQNFPCYNQLLQSDLSIPEMEVTSAIKRSVVGPNEVTLKNLKDVLFDIKKQHSVWDFAKMYHAARS